MTLKIELRIHFTGISCQERLGGAVVKRLPLIDPLLGPGFDSWLQQPGFHSVLEVGYLSSFTANAWWFPLRAENCSDPDLDRLTRPRLVQPDVDIKMDLILLLTDPKCQ